MANQTITCSIEPRALPGRCFHELFAEQAERTPEAEAVVYRDQRLTYRELNRRANQVAHFLRASGVGPETLVGICMERAPEMMVALFGILKAGGAYLPLDASYPADRLTYMMDDAKAPVVLTQQRLREKISTSAEIVAIDEQWPEIAKQSTERVDSGVKQENLAYVIYTSGSTGKPKGVMIHHRGLVNYLSWASRFYRMWEGAGSLVHSPIGFDLTITTVFGPLMVGQRVTLLPEGLGLDELASALRSQKDYSVVKITPTHLEALAHMLPANELAGRVRVLVIGGEMLRWEHIERWRRHAPATRLINEYGPTETVVGCCIYEARDRVAAGSVPIGVAIDNMQMHVLDADLRPVEPGSTGEIYIGGAGVARGYLNQPETTAAKFVSVALDGVDSRLYKTGDLAHALPDGNLEYLGRTDHQVKIRGYRIELGEIEVALARHPTVRDCAVLAREDGGDKRLVAYIVGRDNHGPAADELRGFLLERLPAYMVPAAFVTLPEFPLTVNGKVDRDALPAPDDRVAAGERPFRAPSETLEIQLAGIWEEVLNVRPIGATDNFFEIGGDSLKAVVLTAKIEEVRGRHIPPALLMEENTIEKLARAIHRLDLEPHDKTIVAVQRNGGFAPLYLVPGIGGMVLGLSYLAQHLGKDQPLFGLQARGIKNDESACGSIEEMARYYVDAIRAAQPDGPYFIGGYSFGGVVAFEIARQLETAGQKLGILAILDTEAPDRRRFDFPGFVQNLPFWMNDFVLRRERRQVVADVRTKVKNISKGMLNKVSRPLGFRAMPANIEDEVAMPNEFPERYRRVIAAHYQALLDYRPGLYSGRITLFRTRAQPLFRAHADNGWRRLAQGGVEIYPVDGVHEDFMVEPHVSCLARQMRIALEKSRTPSNLRNPTLDDVSRVHRRSVDSRLPWPLRPIPRFVQTLITAIFGEL
ncbi:MAG TPA: amino acid adenylation domain-containing protein [Candidatus Binatia bacterium]